MQAADLGIHYALQRYPGQLMSYTLLAMQFTKAVEAKQVAQQEAERARFVVMKAEQVSRIVLPP